jgi:uncharacterized cupin superfamily protein
MKPKILNVEKVKVDSFSHGKRVHCDIAWVGAAIRSRKLGYNITVIPPGKRSFPFHLHHGNEEMFFILEGKGSIRIGNSKRRLRQGDFVSLPPGPDSAHQIVNDSKAPLRFLAVSTMEVPEVVEYPDSGKIGVFTGAHAGHPAPRGALREFLRRGDAMDYWDGEK